VRPRTSTISGQPIPDGTRTKMPQGAPVSKSLADENDVGVVVCEAGYTYTLRLTVPAGS